MLAAWLRMKFPNTFAGAHAASAPILFYPDTVSPYGFNAIITDSFTNSSAVMKEGQYCSDFIRYNQNSLQKASTDKKQYADIKKAYQTCDDITKPEEVMYLASLVNDATGNIAMVNYPYPANLLGELPANPVKNICNNFAKLTLGKDTDEKIWAATALGMNLLFPLDKTKKCLDIKTMMTPSAGGEDT